MRLAFVVFLLVTLIGLVSSASAAPGVNKQIPFTASLKDSAGDPVTDGDYDIVFRIYNASSGGTTLWTGTHTAGNGNAVSVTDGIFRVMLGSGTGNTLDLDFNDDTYYLGLTVEADSEMTPRQRLGATGYAINSDTVDGLQASFFLRSNATTALATSSADTLLTITQSGGGDILNIFDGVSPVLVVRDGGNVGIGTSTPNRTLTIAGDTYLTGALYDTTNSSGTVGYVLQSTGTSTKWVATSSLNISSGGGSGITSLNGQVGASQTFATSTSGGINLVITSAGNTHTFTANPTIGFAVPLSASTTEWGSFYSAPSTRITAGTGLSWSSNTLNLDNDFGASIDESEFNIAGSPTNNYLLVASSTAAGGFAWATSTSLNIDTTLSEASVESFIFDADNSGTLSSGTLALDSLSYTGTLDDTNVNNNLTISGGTIDNTPIGETTSSTARFTTATSADQIILSSLTLSSITSGLLTTDNSGVVSASSTLSDAFVSDDLTLGTGASFANDIITPDSVLSSGPQDEYCLTYELTGTTWEWQDCSAGSINLTDLGDVNTTNSATGTLLLYTGSGWATTSTSSLNIVSLAGEDFLSLSGQEITANAINPDNLASTDFGSFTCNGTTCSLDNGTVATNTLNASNWSNGYVLQASTTATGGFAWVATSTLGFSDTDTNYFTQTGSTTYLTGLNDFFGLGTSSPASTLDIYGDLRAGTSSRPTFFVDASTNQVGIGTSTPAADLHIYSTINADLLVQGFSGSDYASVVRLAGENENSWQGGYMQYDGSFNKFIIGVHDASDTSTSSDTEVLVIDRSSAFVGIGTTSPAQKLTVRGNIFTGGLTATGSVTFRSLNNGGFLTTDVNGVLSTTTIATSDLIGTLAVSSGGTGATTLTGILLGNGTSPFTASTSIADSYLDNDLTIDANGSVDSTALTDGGTISFDWVDDEVADDLTISGGTIDNTPIGETTSSTARFTTATSADQIILSSLTLSSITSGLLTTDNSGVVSASSTLSDAFVSDDLTISASSTIDPQAITLATGNVLIGDSSNNAIATSSLFVDTSGNVGIGTTSPDVELLIHNENDYSILGLSTVFNGSDSDLHSQIVSRIASGTMNTKDAVNDNQKILTIAGDAYNGTQLERAAQIQFQVDGTDVTGSGNHPGGEIRFLTRGTTNTGQYNNDLQMIIRNDGRVGIGSSSPSRKLTVGGDIFTAGLTATGSVTFRSLNNGGFLTTDANGLLSTTTVAASDLSLANGYLLRGGTSGLAEATNSLFIADSGNVGAGSTSPSAKFAIHALAGETNTSLFRISSSSALSTSTLFDVDNTGLATIGDPNDTGDASMQFAADNNAWSLGYYSSDKTFRIASSTNLGASVAFSIAKDTLNVGIGSSTPSRKLTVVGTMAVNGLSAVAGTDQSVCIDPTTKEITTQAGDTCAVSSARYKNTIEDLPEGGLEQLNTLRSVSFKYNDDENDDLLYWGFIAEEAASTSPQLAYFNEDGTVQTINTTGILSLTVKSVQELDEKINALTGFGLATSTNQEFRDSFVDSLLGRIASWLADAGNGLTNLFAENIKAVSVSTDTVDTNTLCLEGVCLTKDELQTLLEQSANDPAPASVDPVNDPTPPTNEEAEVTDPVSEEETATSTDQTNSDMEEDGAEGATDNSDETAPITDEEAVNEQPDSATEEDGSEEDETEPVTSEENTEVVETKTDSAATGEIRS